MEIKGFCEKCGAVRELMVIFYKGEETPHCIECGSVVKTGDDKERGREVKTCKRILIAEDSALNAEMIKDIIKKNNLSEDLCLCSTGEEVVERFVQLLRKDKAIDIIILDINMPVMNGINAGISIRAIEKGFEQPKQVPFIFAEKTESLVKFFKYLKPALYLKKGDIDTSDLQLKEAIIYIKRHSI